MSTNSPDPNQARPPQFAEHRVIDEQHGGMVVSAFAYPSAWSASSRVFWNYEDTSLPVRAHAAAFNPRGVESFEFHPTEAFFWLEPNYGYHSVGQYSRGQVCMPPRPAGDALVNLVIPKLRNGRQNLRLVGAGPAPNIWQVFGDQPPRQGEGVTARVEYEERGHAVEEEFYGVFEWNQAPSQTSVQTNWGFGRLFSFRAARGRIDSLRQTFWRIAGSLKANPQWQQLREQIQQQLNAGFQSQVASFYANLRAQQEMSRQNMAYNDQLIEQRNAQVDASIARQKQLNQERAQSPYTSNDAFGDALMGRTAYPDPNSAVGNYHYEYDGNNTHVYTDGQGNWYSTPDSLDNPNDHTGRTWTRVEPKKID